MKKMLSLVLVVIGTVFAVSCGGNSGAASEKPTDKNDAAIQSSAITVDDLVGKEFAITNMYEGKEVTIAFPATNMIGGKSAVNNYFTEFTLNGDKISFKALGSTKMAGPEEDMAVENEYLQLLGAADTISLNGDVLTIITTTGTNLVYTFKGNVEVATENAN